MQQPENRPRIRKERKKHFADVSLNLSVRGLSESPTLAIDQLCRQLQSQGRSVYRLGLGQSPFPVPGPVVEALRENAHQKDYLNVRGLPELREAVADYFERTQGVSSNADNVLIGPGSKELMFLVQLVYYGDLAIPSPSWVSYAPQARIIGRQIHWLPTRSENGWKLMPDELERLCSPDPGHPRLVILNYPSNPTGLTYRLDELQALAQVARKYRVILVSDEIYGELHHTGKHASIARFYPEGTVISSGLSKWCGAGGWRLGTFCFPNSLSWLRNAMSVVASETFTSTSSPIQFAAIRAYQGGEEIERYLDGSRRLLRALGRHVAGRLKDSGVDVRGPQGGFYLFPQFGDFREGLVERGIETSQSLCERLLQDTGVAMLPGSAFGRDPSDLTARMAYVDFDGGKALDATIGQPADESLSEQFLRAHCNRVTEAVDRLIRWLP